MGVNAGDTNLQRYVGNDVTNETDPTGRSWVGDAFSSAAKFVDQTAGVAGNLILTGELIPLQDASASALLGGAGTGAADGGAVIANTATFGTAFKERSERVQSEALKRGDVITQIGFGGGKVGAHALQALAVVGTAGVAAPALEGTAAGTFLSSPLVTTTATALGASGAVKSGMQAVQDFQDGNIADGIDNSVQALIGAKAVKDAIRAANPASARLSCFFAGTPVATVDGLRPIESIVAGERVWAYDLVTSEWRLRHVLRAYSRPCKGNAASVTVAGETINSTYRHPYFVVRGEDLEGRPSFKHLPKVPNEATTPGRWVDAGDLRVGDELLLLDGRIERIEQVSLYKCFDVVYNFEVDDLRCYAVGLSSVLVHNENGDELNTVPELFERTFQTRKGPIGFLAETEVAGDTLTLKNIVVYGESATPLTGLTREVLAARTQLIAEAKALGFKKLRITGQRVESSSSTNPGHFIDITLDLTK